MKEMLTYLYGLERRGVKVGLDHTEQLLEKIGNPHMCFSSIHVSGTNGKGSTCSMMASIFREAKLKIGEGIMVLGTGSYLHMNVGKETILLQLYPMLLQLLLQVQTQLFQSHG